MLIENTESYLSFDPLFLCLRSFNSLLWITFLLRFALEVRWKATSVLTFFLLIYSSFFSTPWFTCCQRLLQNFHSNINAAPSAIQRVQEHGNCYIISKYFRQRIYSTFWSHSWSEFSSSSTYVPDAGLITFLLFLLSHSLKNKSIISFLLL